MTMWITILISILLGLGFDFSHMFSQAHLTELYSHKGRIIGIRLVNKTVEQTLLRILFSVDAAESATRARTVRGVEEIKCAFTEDTSEQEQGQCSFGGCRVSIKLDLAFNNVKFKDWYFVLD